MNIRKDMYRIIKPTYQMIIGSLYIIMETKRVDLRGHIKCILAQYRFTIKIIKQAYPKDNIDSRPIKIYI